MPERTADKICAAVAGIEEPRVVCLGATYKPNVRDLRESPALEVHRILRSRGLDAALYDPLVPSMACDSVLSAARGADVLAILVPHHLILTELQYRRHEILRVMRRPQLLAFSPGTI
jgi:UDP-N-acetyl-D-mannosaminuronate dehydrogenase